MANDGFITEAAKTSSVSYPTIYDGQLCYKRATPADGFEKYVTKHSKKHAGKEVFMKKLDKINGYLVDIQKEQRDTFDKNNKYTVLVFTFQSPTSDRRAKLEVSIKSNFVAAIAKRIEVIDLLQPIEFGAFYSNQNNKEINWFKQNGAKISAQFTKENPRDLPQWTKNEVTDENDNTAYWTYLVGLLRRVASEEKLQEVRDMITASQSDFESEGDEAEVSAEIGETAAAQDEDIPF